MEKMKKERKRGKLPYNRKLIPQDSLLQKYSVGEVVQMMHDGVIKTTGIDECKGGLSGEDVGKLLGVSKMRISQCEMDGLLKLLKALDIAGRVHGIEEWRIEASKERFQKALKKLEEDRALHAIELERKKKLWIARRLEKRNAQ